VDNGKYYTSATDKHGHSAHRRIGFPPDIVHKMEIMVQSARNPFYRTMSDIVRDAVVKLLMSQNGEDPQFAMDMVVIESERVEAEARHVDDLLDKMRYGLRNGNMSVTEVLSACNSYLAQTDNSEITKKIRWFTENYV
jgi:Arc/MetJ-type ribon-helix-helix transcriptional regulator